MSPLDKPIPLDALIEAHEAAWAKWEAISLKIQEARHVHDELEKEHEASNNAERAALLAVMAHPVETLEDARVKAAYFLSVSSARDVADETTLQFMRSLAGLS